MADHLSSELRSKNMAAVKGGGNKSTELALIKVFRKEKIKGWRRGSRLIGKPDFVFPDKKIAVFVDGCFWHGCKRCKNIPRQNRFFWEKKITNNTLRDRLVSRVLRKAGWRVVRIWEHDLRGQKMPKALKFVPGKLV